MSVNKKNETDITYLLVGVLVLLIAALVIRSTTILTSTKTSTNSRASEKKITPTPSLTPDEIDLARDNWCKTHKPILIQDYDSSKDYCFDGDWDPDEEGRICGMSAVGMDYLEFQKPGTLIDKIIYEDKTTRNGLTCGVALDQFRPGSNRCCRHIESEVIEEEGKLARQNNQQFGDEYCKRVLGDSSAVCIGNNVFDKAVGLSKNSVCMARHNLPVSDVTCAQIESNSSLGYVTDYLYKGFCCGVKKERR